MKSEEKQIKERIARYRHDYFFHYLLIHNKDIRKFYCQYLSQDKEIKETFLINNDFYSRIYNGKKVILDILVQDDKGRYYNFEIQNYDIDMDDQIRFLSYGEHLLDTQLKRGMRYRDIKPVYQMIIYTGKPISGYHSYKHYIRKADRHHNIDYKGDRMTTVLFQLEYLEEGRNMENRLKTMEQLNYLIKYDQPHPNSIMSQEVEQVIELHDKYTMSESELIEAYRIERDRILIDSKLASAKEDGIEIGTKKGIEIGRLESLQESVLHYIRSKYNKDASDWIYQCNYEQLKQIFLIDMNLTYEELYTKIINYKSETKTYP